jgi:RHS repeat-associated protein
LGDPLDRLIAFDYDRLNRTVKEYYVEELTTEVFTEIAGAPSTRYVYDLASNLKSRTDREGNVTEYRYDRLHRLWQEIDANQEATVFYYDAVGNLTSLTDPEENQTTWEYDPLNRPIEETNELAKTRYFTYDEAGNLFTKTDRNGRVTEYQYDNLNRLTSELWKDGVSTVRTLSFDYDAVGLLTDASDPTATYEYTYNGLNQLLTETQDIAGLTPNISFSREYYATTMLKSVATTIGSSADYKNEFQYDDLNRLTRITQAGQGGGNAVAEKRVDFAYNAASQFDTITRYADLAGTDLVATTTFGYEAGIGRLESIAHAKGLTTLASYDYSYDLAGRIDAIDSLLDGLTTYSHDNRGQLTAADHASSTDEAYQYDDNGNRTGGDYETDPNNLTVEDAAYTYGYDDEGNRVLRTDKTTGDYIEYGWDHRNRLTLVAFKNSSNTTTKKVALEYDAFDRRVRKRVDDDGNGTWDRGEQYVYDGAHIALVFDDSGDLVRRNLFGPAIDQILASEFIGSPNETNWYFTDHLGTVRDVYSYDDILDEVVSEGHIEYDSFGNIIDGTLVAEKAHFAYTGREWDADIELYYYRARYYDPVLGKFISPDPIGFAAGDANLQRYVGNRSVSYIDPSGLFDESLTPNRGTWMNNAKRGDGWYKPPGRNSKPIFFRCGEPIFEKTPGAVYRFKNVNGHVQLPLDQSPINSKSQADYESKLKARRNADNKAADAHFREKLKRELGASVADKWKRPGGYTWHHARGGKMLLVKTSIHRQAVPHLGGFGQNIRSLAAAGKIKIRGKRIGGFLIGAIICVGTEHAFGGNDYSGAVVDGINPLTSDTMMGNSDLPLIPAQPSDAWFIAKARQDKDIEENWQSMYRKYPLETRHILDQYRAGTFTWNETVEELKYFLEQKIPLEEYGLRSIRYHVNGNPYLPTTIEYIEGGYGVPNGLIGPPEF